MYAPLVVVMGVAGSGKTVVGEAIARRLGVEYADADDFHPPENVAKMRAGEALSEADREPWLEAIGDWLGDRAGAGAVASCSALRLRYRDQLREGAPSAVFLHLHAEEAMLRERMLRRTDHFMPDSLLDSQLATLESLEADEPGVTLDAAASPDTIVTGFMRWWGGL